MSGTGRLAAILVADVSVTARSREPPRATQHAARRFRVVAFVPQAPMPWPSGKRRRDLPYAVAGPISRRRSPSR